MKASLTASRLWWPEAPVCRIHNWLGPSSKRESFFTALGVSRARVVGKRGYRGTSSLHPAATTKTDRHCSSKPCWRLRGHRVIVSISPDSLGLGGLPWSEFSGGGMGGRSKWVWSQTKHLAKLHHPATMPSPPQKARLLSSLSMATGSVLLGSETWPGLRREMMSSPGGGSIHYSYSSWVGGYPCHLRLAPSLFLWYSRGLGTKERSKRTHQVIRSTWWGRKYKREKDWVWWSKSCLLTSSL